MSLIVLNSLEACFQLRGEMKQEPHYHSLWCYSSQLWPLDQWNHVNTGGTILGRLCRGARRSSTGHGLHSNSLLVVGGNMFWCCGSRVWWSWWLQGRKTQTSVSDQWIYFSLTLDPNSQRLAVGHGLWVVGRGSSVWVKLQGEYSNTVSQHKH